MRAVFLCVVGLFIASPVNAGSLLPQDTVFSEKSDVKDLGLPSFSDGAQADALSFNAIGQGGSTQIYDLGGKPGPAASGDLLQGLPLNLGGTKSAPQGTAKQTE